MGIFKRGGVDTSHTDAGLVGGVIKWTPRSNDELVWKYPSERIKKGAKLQVHNTQEAALFINGACVKVFRGGGEAYTISESSNIPLLETALNIATGGENVYFAEIWFVNVETIRRIKWFADENNGLKFPYNNTLYSGRIVCDCAIKIVNSELFLSELVGKLNNFDSDDIEAFFKSNLISITVESLLTIYTEMGVPFNEFIIKRDIMQSKLEIATDKILYDRFGIDTSLFAVERIFSPDLEEFWAAQKERARLAALGVNYVQERQLDIIETAAQNEGGTAATLMGAGIGFSAGAGMGSTLNQTMQTPPSQQAPPPLPQQNVQFFYSANGLQVGPVDIIQMASLITSGTVTQSTLVWRAGMAQWQPAEAVADIASLFKSTPPPIPTNL